MSKCRYDLSEDCHNKDCLNCVLDKIISEAQSLKILYTDHDKDTYRRGINDVLKIIDKYRAESEKNKYEVEVITRGNCMMCGKPLTEGEGLFFCEKCENKVMYENNKRKKEVCPLSEEEIFNLLNALIDNMEDEK